MSFSFFLPGYMSQTTNLEKPHCPRVRCYDEDYLEELDAYNNARLSGDGKLTAAFILNYVVSLLNLLIQLFCIQYILKRKYFKKVSKLVMSKLVKEKPKRVKMESECLKM